MSKTPSMRAKKKERPAKVLQDLVDGLNSGQGTVGKHAPM